MPFFAFAFAPVSYKTRISLYQQFRYFNFKRNQQEKHFNCSQMTIKKSAFPFLEMHFSKRL
ncbi:MAG: hypothetical protein BGO52_11410 [Sphingobacteriales bacterium 44-61]|nr:MAG: hypothetical protein BGO52_11410 [Sphingobacteriales bacterium 44-61]